MTLPSSYTEATLKTYMLTCLGGLGAVLGLTTDSFAEAVNDVLVAYGVDALADATDIPQVRALAKVAALRTAQATAAGWYDFGADGGDFKRSQIAKQLEAMLTVAESEALSYLDSYSIETGTMAFSDDPYVFSDDDEE